MKINIRNIKNVKIIDFLSLILIIIFMILLYLYAQLKFFNKPYVNFCGYTIFQVITGSMDPVIKTDDIVIVKLTKNIKENDIITYKSGENFITHRIIKKDGDKIITKGDANPVEDSPTNRGAVAGKVIFIISNVAVWTSVLKSPKVIIALIISLIVIRLLFFNKHTKWMITRII